MSSADITSLCDAAVVAWKKASQRTRKVRFDWRGYPFVSTLTSFRILVNTASGDPVAERYGSPDEF